MRGHLAANIDPLGLNNMDREEAKKMIIRSVTVHEKVGKMIKHSHYLRIYSKLYFLPQEFSEQVKCTDSVINMGPSFA